MGGSRTVSETSRGYFYKLEGRARVSEAVSLIRLEL
jgi:hypothetical protein